MPGTSPRGTAAIAGLALSLVLASQALALEACRARIDPRTGLIQVQAAKVGGPILWRATPVATGSPLFDSSCVKHARAAQCLLADPTTVAARTPPAACTLYLTDGVADCSTWVQGCLPGSRTALDLAGTIVGTWLLHQGGTITFNADGSFATSELTTGTYRVVGESVLLDIDSIPGELDQVLTYLGTTPAGQLIFAQETPLGLTRTP